MISSLRALAALLVLTTTSIFVQAADYYVDITNKTGYTIMYMYVSPDHASSWEEDVLGSKVLINGDTKRVNLNGYKSPIFDIKLVDSDGDSYTFWDVDVSKRDITVTLADLDSGSGSSSVASNDYYVDITNNTGFTIMYMYVSPDNSSSWEDDVLGSSVLVNGDTKRVTLTGYSSPIFDIKLVDSDGDSYTFWDVDVSKRDLNVTLLDLDT